jgi:hypothetical protein
VMDYHSCKFVVSNVQFLIITKFRVQKPSSEKNTLILPFLSSFLLEFLSQLSTNHGENLTYILASLTPLLPSSLVQLLQ